MGVGVEREKEQERERETFSSFQYKLRMRGQITTETFHKLHKAQSKTLDIFTKPA
jgi:hypothetical protein